MKKMPSILLVSVNARYTHSCPALYTLEKLCTGIAEAVHHETTINCDPAAEAAAIAERKPDIVCFSTYIWNGTVVQKIAEALCAELPSIRIIAGGPEAWHNEWTGFHLAQSLKALVNAVTNDEYPPKITGEEYHIDELPFAYSPSQLVAMKKRYLYYESSRGCAFSCAYCLSGAGEALSFRSLDKVLAELDLFMTHNVHIVKFVDRTFNIDTGRSLAIWEHIVKYNRSTAFHFEIHPAIMSEREIEFCRSVPAGMFQFEAGVQSTTPASLAAVSRTDDTQRALDVISAISKRGNIHLHAGLIAGLPRETEESFLEAIDKTVAARPHYIQIGTLKLLRGSPLYNIAGENGISASQFPPYQVLKTSGMPLGVIMRFSQLEHLFNILYNDSDYPLTLEYILEHTASASHLFMRLMEECAEEKISLDSHKREKIGELLYRAARLASCADTHFGDRAALEWAPSLHPYPQWLSNYTQRAELFHYALKLAQRESGLQPARGLLYVPEHPETPLLANLPGCDAYFFSKRTGAPFVSGRIWFSA